MGWHKCTTSAHPPKIFVDVEVLLQREKAISSEVPEKGLMFSLEKLRQNQKKRTVSVFVGKSSRKIKPNKDMAIRQLSYLGIKILAVIAGTSNAF